MPTFQFTARDADGRWHNGTESTATAAALSAALRQRGLSPVSVRPAARQEEEEPTSRSGNRGFGILPATSLDVEMGLRMLSNMLDGGLTLLSSLTTCADQARRIKMAKVWDSVHDRVANGASFAEAMDAHRSVFPQLVIKLTRAGEASGNLEQVLEQAADQLERNRTLMITVFSAMMYPTITTVMAIGVGAFMMIKIVPELADFLRGQGKQLPGVTLALIATSDFINKYGVPIGIIVISLVVAIVVSHQFPPGARVIDRMLLRVPVVGKILRLSATTMFARGLSMLLEAGVPVISALETAGGLVKNKAVGARVEQTRQSVLAGQSINKPLGAGTEFLPMLPRMVAVGEETGTLGVVLGKVANFHEKQLEAYVKRMTLLIEPVMTIVVGGLVGFVYLAFFMAIYAVAGKSG